MRIKDKIDTHALIWFITDNDKLPIKTIQIIENKENNCYVSIATYWEPGQLSEQADLVQQRLI